MPMWVKNGRQESAVVSCPPPIAAVLKNVPTNLFALKLLIKKFNNCITFEQRNLTYNAPFIHNCPQLSNKAKETKNFIFQTNKTYINKYLLLSWAGMTPNLVGIPNKIPSASAN